MAETFTSKDGSLRVLLFEKKTATARIVGGQVISAGVEYVELSFVDRSTPGRALEMTLEDFHELFYKKLFPAVARRINIPRRK
jgi:hypothetical protein